MNGQDYEQLTLFQEDSPASHSLLPGSGQTAGRGIQGNPDHKVHSKMSRS